MKKEDAIKLIHDTYPNHEIDKVTETEKYFLVAISPKIEGNSGPIKLVPCNDGLKAVVKADGKIFTYNPIRDGR